jgi:hypothetical protein
LAGRRVVSRKIIPHLQRIGESINLPAGDAARDGLESHGRSIAQALETFFGILHRTHNETEPVEQGNGTESILEGIIAWRFDTSAHVGFDPCGIRPVAFPMPEQDTIAKQGCEG